MKYIAPLPALPKFMLPKTAKSRAAVVLLVPLVAAFAFLMFSIFCDYARIFLNWGRDVDLGAALWVLWGSLLLSTVLIANAKNWPWALAIFLSGPLVFITLLNVPPALSVPAYNYFISMRVAQFMKYGSDACRASATVIDGDQRFGLCEIFNTAVPSGYFDGIIYDSGDQVLRPKDQRSQAWSEAARQAKLYFITKEMDGTETRITPISDHFYLVSEAVNPNRRKQGRNKL